MYDWQQAAENQKAPTMAEGYHLVRVGKVLRGPKDGEPFASRDGDPKLLVVFKNAAGEEAANMFTLTTKAAWVLAKFLRVSGADLARMEADGIEPDHFADAEFAREHLEDRECWVNVTYKAGGNGKQYAEFEFLFEEDVPPTIVKEASDIPF